MARVSSATRRWPVRLPRKVTHDPREAGCRTHVVRPIGRRPTELHHRQVDWMAETKKDTVKAFDAFVETYQIKYHRAADCLTKDRDALLAFYDFPPSIGSTYERRTP